MPNQPPSQATTSEFITINSPTTKHQREEEEEKTPPQEKSIQVKRESETPCPLIGEERKKKEAENHPHRNPPPEPPLEFHPTTEASSQHLSIVGPPPSFRQYSELPARTPVRVVRPKPSCSSSGRQGQSCKSAGLLPRLGGAAEFLHPWFGRTPPPSPSPARHHPDATRRYSPPPSHDVSRTGIEQSLPPCHRLGRTLISI